MRALLVMHRPAGEAVAIGETQDEVLRGLGCRGQPPLVSDSLVPGHLHQHVHEGFGEAGEAGLDARAGDDGDGAVERSRFVDGRHPAVGDLLRREGRQGQDKAGEESGEKRRNRSNRHDRGPFHAHSN